jgi:hypothetical protein
MLVLSLNCFGQCGSKIKTYKADECEVVMMSDSMFTTFYVARKNLDTIHAHLPLLKRRLLELDSISVEEKLLYNKEILTLDSVNTALTVKNKSLSDKNKKLKKERAGCILTTVLVVILGILIN